MEEPFCPKLEEYSIFCFSWSGFWSDHATYVRVRHPLFKRGGITTKVFDSGYIQDVLDKNLSSNRNVSEQCSICITMSWLVIDVLLSIPSHDVKKMKSCHRGSWPTVIIMGLVSQELLTFITYVFIPSLLAGRAMLSSLVVFVIVLEQALSP
jgi:hypothetical protein